MYMGFDMNDVDISPEAVAMMARNLRQLPGPREMLLALQSALISKERSLDDMQKVYAADRAMVERLYNQIHGKDGWKACNDALQAQVYELQTELKAHIGVGTDGRQENSCSKAGPAEVLPVGGSTTGGQLVKDESAKAIEAAYQRWPDPHDKLQGDLRYAYIIGRQDERQKP